MLQKLAFSGLGLALVLFAAVAALTRPGSVLAAGGCFTTSQGSEICAVVQHCDGLTCHYHLYTDSPPCRPSGSGPDCGVI
jgi:hypothetical protein